MRRGEHAAPTPQSTSGRSALPEPTQPQSVASQSAREVLATEYNVLMAALNAAWSASLTRTSLFLGVVSAAGVAFGFASQGGVDSSTFLALAFLVLLLT